MASISGRRMPNLSWPIDSTFTNTFQPRFDFSPNIFNMTAKMWILDLQRVRKPLGRLKNEWPKSISHQQAKLNAIPLARQTQPRKTQLNDSRLSSRNKQLFLLPNEKKLRFSNYHQVFAVEFFRKLPRIKSKFSIQFKNIFIILKN